MTTILDTITAQRALDVRDARAAVSEEQLQALISASAFAPCNIHTALSSASTQFSLIAEIKRASPSKGDIAPGMNAAEQGLRYAHAGALGISVLTEPKWFKGSLEDMLAVRTALQAAFPQNDRRPFVLRKDFIFDTYQLLEARANGADTVLLIVKCLSQELLESLLEASRGLGMEPLVEVADADETRRAVAAGAKVIGVNNRNLTDFTLDMGRTSALAALIPPNQGVILVALSGIATRTDVVRFASSGARGVLVGEALMRAKDPARYISWLLGSSGTREPLVKVCGVSTVEHALCAARNGADLIGMICVPESKRYVPPELAKQIIQAVRADASQNSKAETDSALQELRALAGGDVSREWGKSEWFRHTADILERVLLQRRPLFVAVFADDTSERINSVAADLGVDLVQLHGTTEPAGLSLRINFPVIRAIHVAPHDTTQSVVDQLVPGRFAFGLLDTFVRTMPEAPMTRSRSLTPSELYEAAKNASEPEAGTGVVVTAGVPNSLTAAGSFMRPVAALLKQGGSGVTFDWKVAKDVAAVHAIPVLVAGGLSPSNVMECVAVALPWGVDVSSGVETNGAKDSAKIIEFITQSKEPL